MLRLSIGNVCIEIELPPTWGAGNILERFAGFWTVRQPDFRLLVNVEPGLEIKGFSTEELGVQRIWLEEKRALLAGFDIQGEADLRTATGRLRLDANPNTLDSALRALFIILLPRHSGLILHAAGLQRKGAGWLFCGASGSGKSSISRSLRDGELLNDETVCVVRRQERFYILSTPFWGELEATPGSPRISAPLHRLVLLNPEKCGLLEPMEAFLGLLANVICPAGGDRANFEKIMDLTWGVVQTAVSQGLVFDWTTDNWGVLDEMVG